MGSMFLEQIQPEFVLGNRGRRESVDPGLEYIGREESSVWLLALWAEGVSVSCCGSKVTV